MGKSNLAFMTMLMTASTPLFAEPRVATVAIYEMRDNTRQEVQPTQQQNYGYNRGYSGRTNGQPSPPAPAVQSKLALTIQDTLSQAIVSTNKFRVVERSQLRVLLNEQLKGRSGLVTSDTPNRIGGFEGADYLIYGSINQLNFDQRTHTLSPAKNGNSGAAFLGALLGGQSPQAPQPPQTCRYVLGSISINIRIVDAQTGEVRYSAPVDLKEITDTDCPGVPTENIYRKAGQTLAFNLVTAIYPMQVASILPSRELIINYGRDFLSLGTLLTIYSKGAEIRDPATGQTIGNDETLIGLAEISEVSAQLSKGTPVLGFDTPAVIGSIARIATDQQRKEWEEIKTKARAAAEAANKKKKR
jgi:curli biogenesis system outer membrane secretion channel CsgG